MYIPEETRQSVVFIGYRPEYGPHSVDAPKLAGTGFFVGYPIPGTERFDCYVVTARHVIEEIKKRGGEPLARANRILGGLTWGRLPADGWVFNVDDRVDVAAIAIGIDMSGLDHRILVEEMLLTDERVKAAMIAPGEDVFFPGLFTGHSGESSNITIVRFGHIAAMPEERIRTDCGNLRGYLIEARSIGGLSGSPVFIQHRMDDGSSNHFVIGLIHGHFGVRGLLDFDDAVADSQKTRSVNQGIAIVVPASDIRATLEHDEFVKRRARLAAETAASKEDISNRGN